MADEASASTSYDAEKARSYLGCLVCLYTKSELRYEGFVFYLDPEECIIGLKNVKSYGTEGRRKGGPQVPPMASLSEYMYFRSIVLKDVKVLSFPSENSTSDLPDDPAIIKPHSPDLPAATISLVTPSTFLAEDIDSDTQTGFEAPPPFPGNLLPRSVGVSVSEPPPPLMPPVSAGSLPFIATLPPPPSIQKSSISFAQLFSNFTIDSMQNKASGTLPAAMVNSSSEAVSSSDANPVVTPVTQTSQSLLCSHPILSGTESSTMGPSSSVERPKALNTQIHEPASPSHFIDRRHIQNQGDRVHESNRGHFQARGGRGNLKIRGPSPPPQHYNINPGRGYVLNQASYPHHDVGSQAYEGSSKSAGRGNINVTEQRRIDVETFGEIRNPQRGHAYSIAKPSRGGRTYWGHYRGRGSNISERGCGRESYTDERGRGRGFNTNERGRGQGSHTDERGHRRGSYTGKRGSGQESYTGERGHGWRSYTGERGHGANYRE